MFRPIGRYIFIIFSSVGNDKWKTTIIHETTRVFLLIVFTILTILTDVNIPKFYSKNHDGASLTNVKAMVERDLTCGLTSGPIRDYDNRVEVEEEEKVERNCVAIIFRFSERSST